MAFSVGAIEAKLTANTAQFNTNVQKATGHLQTFQDRALRASKQLKEIGDAADRAAKRATLALAALVGVMGNAVRMASAQREAELRLAAAIRGTGQAIDVNKIRAYAAELQNLTTYGDEATIEAAGLLATFQLTENAIVALLPRIQNLSAMYKMDLSQAALQVGRALTQGAGALSRYGITMTEAEKQAYNMATQTEKVAMLLEIFDRNTGDAAQTLAGTGVGAFTQFKNAVGDLNEAIGFLLEQRVADFFQEATQKVQRLTTWFQNLDQDTRDQIVTWVGWTAGILAAVAGISMLVSVLAKLGSALALTARAIAAHPAVFLGAVAVGLALSIDQVREKLMDLAKGIPGIGDAIADMSEEWAALTADLPDVDPSNVDQWVKDAMAGLQAEIAAEGALAGTEWARAFAKAAGGLPDLLDLPGSERVASAFALDFGKLDWITWSTSEIQEAINLAQTYARIGAFAMKTEAEALSALSDAMGRDVTKEELDEALGVFATGRYNLEMEQALKQQLAGVAEALGLQDATEEQLEAALGSVQQFAHDLAAELSLGPAIAAATGETFDPVEAKLEATRSLLHALVEEAGVPVSSPFAQQLLGWIEDLNAQIPRTLSLIERLLQFETGTTEADLGARLQALQRQAEGADIILAKAAQSQIDAAVSAFEESFLRTADTGQAAAAALVALIGIEPNFRMLDSQLTDAADYVERTRTELEQFADALRFAGSSAAGDLADTLLSLQETALGGDPILAEAAQRRIDAAVAAFHDAFYETGDAAQAATAALVALAGTAPNFRMLDSQLTDTADYVEALGDAANLSMKSQRAWALRMQGQADAWRESLSLWEKFTMGLREAGRTLSDRLGAAIVRESPILSDVTSAVQTAGPGGPQAMAVAGLTALLSHSETFGKIMSILNGLLQVAADAIGALLEPLLPLAAVVATVLGPMFSMLGTILANLLVPALSLLFPVIKFAGVVLLYFARGIAWGINQFIAGINLIIRGINWALGWLGVKIKELATINLANFDDAIRELNNLTWDSAKAKAEELAATKAVTEALTNVPEGFKVALARFTAMTPQPIPMAEGGIVTRPTLAIVGERGPEAVVPLGRDGATGSKSVTIGPVYIQSDDPERIWRDLQRIIERENVRGGGTVVTRAPQFVGG